MLNNPHRFTTVASGCSVGGPQRALLMHMQRYGKRARLQNGRKQVLEVSHNPVKQLIHQLRLLLFRHVDNGSEAFAGEPAGFGVGAAAAGEYEDAGIGPTHGVEVGLEAFFGNGVGQALDVLGRLPVLPVFIYVGPVEGAGRFVIGLAADVKILEIANILRRVGKWRIKILRKEKKHTILFPDFFL